MRTVRVMRLAIGIVFTTALSLGLFGQDAAGTCTAPTGCKRPGLPAAITLSADLPPQDSASPTRGRVPRVVTYRIARDGRLSRAANPQSPYPEGAAWFPGTNTWFMIRDRHLLVGRGRRTLWRSHSQIAARQLGVIAAGPHAVAFQEHHRLYIAPYDGAAQPVAARELPLGWTSGGLYTYSYPRRELLLRDQTGAIVARLARKSLEYEFDLKSHSLYYITDGVIFGAHGTRTWRLGSLQRLGMSRDTGLVPLGGLVELQGERRLVLLRPDGSLFASTPLLHDRGLPDGPSSQLQIAPRGDAVAYTVAFGQSPDPNATRRVRGTETVYVLRAGADAATPLHVEQVAFAVCERSAALQWHGSWLLYSNTEGSLAAIDTAPLHSVIDLTGIAHRLIDAGGLIDAHWSRG